MNCNGGNKQVNVDNAQDLNKSSKNNDKNMNRIIPPDTYRIIEKLPDTHLEHRRDSSESSLSNDEDSPQQANQTPALEKKLRQIENSLSASSQTDDIPNPHPPSSLLLQPTKNRQIETKPSPDMNYFDPLSQNSSQKTLSPRLTLKKSLSTGNIAAACSPTFQNKQTTSTNMNNGDFQQRNPAIMQQPEHLNRSNGASSLCNGVLARYEVPNPNALQYRLSNSQNNFWSRHALATNNPPFRRISPLPHCSSQASSAQASSSNSYHSSSNAENNHNLEENITQYKFRSNENELGMARGLDYDGDEEDDLDNCELNGNGYSQCALQDLDDDMDEDEQHKLLVNHFGAGLNGEVDEAWARDEAHQHRRKHEANQVVSVSSDELRKGVYFRAAYLGSTHLFCENRVSRETRLAQCHEALSRIKAPEEESQPTTEVDICISTEKVVIYNAEENENPMMEHVLKTISYTADMGDLVVLMVKRSLENMESVMKSGSVSAPKMLCHVLQSDQASLLAQCIGQAFQVAYMDFLKTNGVEDERYMRMMDYQDVLNSQEIITEEIDMFASKEKHKNVIIPKEKGEILGISIVESGWGSIVPTVVIANVSTAGAGGRTGKLNIGDQILSCDGISFVGLPLQKCQQIIKDTKNKTAVQLSVVPTSPVVTVRIRRPDTRYQLGFSVQNGIICSLLRGGIAERGGIRVGHRIIEINGQSVVSTSHEQVVGMLAHSIGEIQIKTMPTSIYRLLTGQEQPNFI